MLWQWASWCYKDILQENLTSVKGGQEGVSEELTCDLRIEECIKVNHVQREEHVQRPWSGPKMSKWKKASVPDTNSEEKRIYMRLELQAQNRLCSTLLVLLTR